MAPVTDLWQVVGGAFKGGLIVRADKDKSSRVVPGRLATGALVLALEYDPEAALMLFEKVQGLGPETGWVSTAYRSKELLVRTTGEISEEEVDVEMEMEAQEIEELADSEELAIQLYSSRFGVPEEEDGDFAGLRKPTLNVSDDGFDGTSLPESEVRAELERDLSTLGPSSEAGDDLESFFIEDSNLLLCHRCGLPLGQLGYTKEHGKQHLMHGECMAQIMLLEMKKVQGDREAKATALKKDRRQEYDIGWKAEHIPRNGALASKLSCPVPKGLCCVVLDEETHTVSLAATVEPAAAVNLEYLSIALQVRRRNNREPLFSLDPVDSDDKGSMQLKRFEPPWLAGTSVGEVLFQSDYHLKELSMGEYEQPVVGMRNCHDFSEMDGPEWSAREWFVVRKAEVQKSGDNVLMPCVRMGVEAREQIVGEHGLEDVKTTKPNHPLVRYAEAFTHNFDLIAERKSVVHHLRELAKASVLAKFLIEAKVNLDDSWFDLAGETEEACCLEIPQLWNDRYRSQIRVRDGQLVDVGTHEFGTSFHSLYGGVQFGLDRFPLSGSRHSARTMSAGLAARQFIQPSRHLASTLSAGLATRQFQRSFGTMIEPTRVAAGVRLDKFSLSGARGPARMMSAGLAARQFVQPARHLSSTLSAGLATRQFQRSFGPVGAQPARVSAGVGIDKFALSGARTPARLMSAGLAARQFVQPARHLTATLSAGLATRQFQRSFGPVGVAPARVAAGISFDKFGVSGARQPARLMSAGLAARQFVQPARHLSASLSAGLGTRQFSRSFGPVGVQPARVAAGVSMDKFAASGMRQPARMLSAGLAARQFVQPARHLGATLSAGLATRQFQRSFGPVGVQPSRVSASIGIDKFALGGARGPARALSAGLAARQFVQPARHLSATLSAGLATRQFQRSFGPMGIQADVARGVDLNLDEFNLSAPTDALRQDVQLATGVDVSSTFWSNLGNDLPSVFCEEDRQLLRKVFNPALSDRRGEGESFIPPDTSFEYVQRLRALVQKEESLQRQRRNHFFSTYFNKSEPGPLFPASWTSSAEISREDARKKQGCCSLHAHPGYKSQAHVITQVLASTVPVFDASAEDGTRFRIYRCGSLEVRTTQEADGKEEIGAVFSSRAVGESLTPHASIRLDEKIVKATEYVERSSKGCHCYVVMETDKKHTLCAEQRNNGTMKWEENPRDLEDRNSLAKVVRSSDCKIWKTVTAVQVDCRKDVYSFLTGDKDRVGFMAK